jgi:SAM-dependent methyltransferase
MIKKIVKHLIPESRHSSLRRMWNRIKFAGLGHLCPVCGSRLRLFIPHGVVRRPNAVCPVCGVRDRHRLAWLYFQNETPLFTNRMSLLHIAPEPEVAKNLSRLSNLDYLSGDLYQEAMVKMDIAAIPFDDSSFDMVYCSHVLNMLPDDEPAINEIYRILNPGGSAVIQVPRPEEPETVESPRPSTPQIRKGLFGDEGMYRRYGLDLGERFCKAGFNVTAVDYFSRFTPMEQLKFGLVKEDIYLLLKER